MNASPSGASPEDPSKPSSVPGPPLGLRPSVMADLVHRVDWEATPLGAPEQWPEPLRTAVRTTLDAGLPTLLLWGADLVQVYNDACIDVLGDCHPAALGKPARQIWPHDVWQGLGEVVRRVWQTGDPLTAMDRPFACGTGAHGATRYVLGACSAVRDTDGVVRGVLATGLDATQRVLTERSHAEQLAEQSAIAAQLAGIFEQAPGCMCLWRGPDHVIEMANAEFRKISGHRALLAKAARAAFPELRTHDFEILDRVYATGEPHVARGNRYLLRATPDAAPQEVFLDLVLQPLKDERGRVWGILNFGYDVTERTRTAQALRTTEARYRMLLESIDQGYCVVQVLFDDAGRPVDYRYLETNPVFERQTRRPDPIGKTVRELAPDIEPSWIDTYGRVALTGEPLRFEGHVGSLGRTFDVFAFRVDEPQARRVAVFFTDITNRKRREARLRLLSEIATDFARLATAQEIMEAVGRRVATHLGVASCSFCEIDEARDLLSIDYSWTAPGVRGFKQAYSLSGYLTDAFRQASREGRTVAVGDTLADPCARPSALEDYGVAACLSVPFHAAGQWRYMLGVTDTQPRQWTREEIDLFQEITQRVFPRLERARAEAALREADARKNEFLAMLAHELRNPLAPLTNALRFVARKERLSAQGDQAVEMASRQTRQLARLVDDLLEASRVSRGLIELRRELMSVSAAAFHAAEALRPTLESRRQEVEVIVPSKPIQILADPARVAQMLGNLLVNASKFSPEGAVIRMEIVAHPDEVELRVVDRGVGIDPAKLPGLFELFHQIDATIERSQGGLGIGLALVRRLAELHGGRVSAASEGLGKGATFTVRLPRNAPADAARSGGADASAGDQERR